MRMSDTKNIRLLKGALLTSLSVLLTVLWLHGYANAKSEESILFGFGSGGHATKEVPFEAGDHHPPFENDLVIVSGNGVKRDFSIELALTREEHSKGLMFRESMPEDHGMLFVFRAIAPRAFWMKNTLMPLDILFLEEGGRIQHIHVMAKPLDLTQITSGKPVKAILELNGGVTDRLGIKVGDIVYHSAFRNLNLLK